jgi:hypothetical protein
MEIKIFIKFMTMSNTSTLMSENLIRTFALLIRLRILIKDMPKDSQQ